MQDRQPLVLVVDDDSRSRELMTLILRHAGFAVTTAAHPAQAMALRDDARPSLAVVDHLMPGMDGREFCRRARKQPGLSGLTCVRLMGMDSEETRMAVRVAGADDAVIKPFDRINFLARVNSLLERPAAR